VLPLLILCFLRDRIDYIAQGGHHNKPNDVIHNEEHVPKDWNPTRPTKNTKGKKESFRKSNCRDGVPQEVGVEILRQTPNGLKSSVYIEDRNE
jgi:hypothetical protein